MKALASEVVDTQQGKIDLLYINVCKRVNTRLFTQGEIQGQFKNPIPGVVVDSHITLNEMREFYLVSTQSRQGMVKPTRYTIIHDTVTDHSSLD